MSQAQRRGFTLIELLVVVAIIGVLVSLLLPAVQQAREAARRSACKNNLVQIAIALQNYDLAFDCLPPGCVNPTGPIRNLPEGYHHSWINSLLPHLDETTLYHRINFDESIYAPENAEVRSYILSSLLCPSDPGPAVMAVSGGGRAALASYAGAHHPVEHAIDSDNRGVLFLNSSVRFEQIQDGASHTIFVGEQLRSSGDLGWASGTRATLRNGGTLINVTGRRTSREIAAVADFEEREDGDVRDPETWVGGFASLHSGGAHFALGDGSVRFVSQNIDPETYHRLLDRADGQLTGDF